MTHSDHLRRARRVAVFTCALAFAAWGCGGGPAGEPLVPVKGKVTIDGKTLTKGTISFRADKLRGNTNKAEPYASIEEDGTYTVYTGTGKEKRAGAPAGKYIVLVEANEGIDPNNASATPKAIVNPKYSNPDNPVIQIDVEDAVKEGQYDLKVTK